MRLISTFEREDGSVWRLLMTKYDASDAVFVRIKPWSIEWIQFKIRKWRFF